jgi:hypothetical protein
VECNAAVVAGLVTLEAALVAGNLFVVCHHHQRVRIDMQADCAMGIRSGNAVAIALEIDQAGGRYPYRLLDITVKGLRHGHQL